MWKYFLIASVLLSVSCVVILRLKSPGWCFFLGSTRERKRDRARARAKKRKTESCHTYSLLDLKKGLNRFTRRLFTSHI